MKDKSLRQYITELEKIAKEYGDDLPIKIRITTTYLPRNKFYHKPLLRIENPKSNPQVVIIP
jgi:hypothetical protein